MEHDGNIEMLARECLEKADGDRKAAAEALYQKLSDAQRQQLLERYLDRAIWELLRRVGKAGRTAARERVSSLGPSRSPLPLCTVEQTPIQPERLDGLLRLASANHIDLLDRYRLSSGKAIGDATRTELLEEATCEYGAAAAHLQRSLFLRRVAARMGGAARVRAVLTEKDVRSLAQAAIAEVTQ